MLAQLMGIIEALRPKMRVNLADEDFWNEDDGTLQLKSPWIFEEWQQSRDSLFVSAFSLTSRVH